MNFRTTVKQIDYPFSIDYQDHLLLLGSCFTENIGHHLQQSKFDVSINPFGIIYNPISIAIHLSRVIAGRPFPEDAIFQHNDYWYSHLHHSIFSAATKPALLEKINQQDDILKMLLPRCNCLIFTFGTAKVYHHKNWSGIVASCHKLPMKEFDDRLLGSNQVATIFEELLQALKKLSPDLKIIFTLSPVRHIRDGLIENQRSKAILLTAIHEICDRVDFAHYFPAYELLMDDLRDYRFYKSDLIHPSKMAVTYIWEQFRQAFFNHTTEELYQKITALKQAAAHRAFHPTSKQHQQFLQKQLEQLNRLNQTFPFLNLQKERSTFEGQQT